VVSHARAWSRRMRGCARWRCTSDSNGLYVQRPGHARMNAKRGNSMRLHQSTARRKQLGHPQRKFDRNPTQKCPVRYGPLITA
jgi:hypothetical protein